MNEFAVLVEPDPADWGHLPLAGEGSGVVVVGLLLDLGLRLRFLLDHVAGQHLAHHQVGVRAAEPEAGDACDRVPAVAGPVGDGVGDLQMH